MQNKMSQNNRPAYQTGHADEGGHIYFCHESLVRLNSILLTFFFSILITIRTGGAALRQPDLANDNQRPAVVGYSGHPVISFLSFASNSALQREPLKIT